MIKNIALSVLFTFVISFTSPIQACSPPINFKRFLISNNPTKTNLDLQPPNIRSVKVHRGYNDGQHGNCSDMAYIEFSINSPNEMGYLFEVLEGETPDKIFPHYAITTIGKTPKVLTFFWFDLAKEPKPFKFKVAIRSINSSGIKSMPKVILVEDKGDLTIIQKIPTNSWWWNLMIIFLSFGLAAMYFLTRKNRN